MDEHKLFRVTSELNCVRMERDALKMQLSAIKGQNIELKQQISRLAIENSNMENQYRNKRIANEQVVRRWQFYRNNKTQVKKELMAKSRMPTQDIPWYVVKKATDDLFFKQESVNSHANISTKIK